MFEDMGGEIAGPFDALASFRGKGTKNTKSLESE